VTAVVLGGKELVAALGALPNNVFRRVLRTAVKAGIAPVLMAARAKVPIETLQLSKSLSVKIKVYPQSGVIVGMVGATSLRGVDGRDPAKYAHLVEGGHVVRNVEGGPVLGTVAPRPFLTPALEDNREAIVAKFGAKLRQGIDREAKRIAKGPP